LGSARGGDLVQLRERERERERRDDSKTLYVQKIPWGAAGPKPHLFTTNV